MTNQKRKVKKKSESSLVKKGLAFAGVFLLVSVGMNLSFLWANTSVFYPAVCLGDWGQPQLAQGELELGVDDPVEAFNDANSAVLRREAGGQIFCGEFQGEWLEDLAVQNVKLRLSLAVISSPEPQESESETIVPVQDEPAPELIEPEPIQEADEQPVEDSVPTPEETSFIQKIFLNTFQQAVAQETPAVPSEVREGAGEEEQGEEVQLEEPAGDANEDFLEVSYSLGGSEWIPLAKMNHDNWPHFTISLPDITSLLDIANLQVRLEGLSTIYEVPTVYLDGMEVEVEFEQSVGLEDRPVLNLEDSSILFSASSYDFSINQQPVFELQKPSFTIAEVEQLLQEKKISVFSDRKGRFGKRVSPEDEFVVPSLQDLSSESDSEPEASAQSSEGIEADAPQSEEAGFGQDSFFDPLKEILEDIVVSPAEGEESSGEEHAEAQPTPLLEPAIETPGQDVPTSDGEIEPDPPVSEIGEEQEPFPPEAPASPIQDGPADEESSLIRDTVEDLSQALQNLFSYVPGFVNAQGQRGDVKNVKAIVRNHDGDEHSVGITVDSVLEKGEKKFQIRLERAATGFRPGRYTLEVQMETEDIVMIAEQDFTWGVLAINMNKSIYLPGETAYVQMGVIDEAGNTVCDAKLDLKVTHTDSRIVANLSTEDGTIEYSGECMGNIVASKPDYFGYAKLLVEPGEYALELRAVTHKGEYTIADSFQVRESVLFDVERFGPSRIYPPADYEVKFKIKPAEDFTGKVIEEIPLEFTVIQDTRYQIRDTNTKQIVWDVDWKAGGTYELEYTFKAPDVSPYRYLLGPLEFRGNPSTRSGSPRFLEARRWQIASDMVMGLLPEGASIDTLLFWKPSRGGPAYEILLITDEADFDVDPVTGEHYNRIVQMVVNSPRGGRFAFGAKTWLKSEQQLVGPQANRSIPIPGRVTTEGFSWDFTPTHEDVRPGSVSNPSLLTSGGNATISSDDTTAAFTPTANALLVVGWATRSSTTPTTTHAFTNTHAGSGAWATVEVAADTADTPHLHSQARSQMGASPGSGTITNTYTAKNPNRKAWIVAEVTGHHTTTPLSESNTGGASTGTTRSIALVSVAAGNLAIGTVQVQTADAGISEGANETELAEASSGGASAILRTQMQYGTDTTVNWSWVTNGRNAGVAVEYAQAAGAEEAGAANRPQVIIDSDE